MERVDFLGLQAFLSIANWGSFNRAAASLNLSDFGPDAQDAAALELVRQRGALADVQAGRIVQACAKCAPIHPPMAPAP